MLPGTLRRHMAADCGLVSLLLEQTASKAGRGTWEACYESAYGLTVEHGFAADLAKLSALEVGRADVELHAAPLSHAVSLRGRWQWCTASRWGGAARRSNSALSEMASLRG